MKFIILNFLNLFKNSVKENMTIRRYIKISHCNHPQNRHKNKKSKLNNSKVYSLHSDGEGSGYRANEGNSKE